MQVSHIVVDRSVCGILHDLGAEDEIPDVLVCAITKELSVGMARAVILDLGASHAEGLRDILCEQSYHAIHAELGEALAGPGMLHDIERSREDAAGYMRW